LLLQQQKLNFFRDTEKCFFNDKDIWVASGLVTVGKTEWRSPQAFKTRKKKLQEKH